MDAGYTKLPNDLFDWLLAKSSVLSKREIVVLLAIIRNTIGWNRQRSVLSCRFIAKSTGLQPGHVSEAIKSLEQGGMVLVDRSKMTAVVSLNSNVFLSVPESGTLDVKCSRNGNGSVPETVTEVFPKEERKCSRIRNKQIQEITNTEKGKTELADWLTA